MSNDSCGAPAGGVTITKDKAGKEAIIEGQVLRAGAPVSTGYARLLGSGDEFAGRLLAPAHLPQEQAQRGGHIPTAKNVPWSKAANEDGTFKSDDELTTLYRDEAGVDFGKDTIAYCRIGERSAHTWFVLHEILGLPNVKNYDGSWTEYGSLVGVPIELGEGK